ncbi:MAG: HNH endonuclease [Selenomonadaceae bacterium]|nr:HNH endonuclease [Selenomonadaceae bacterium]
MKKCALCGKEFPFIVNIDGKPRNLKNRKYCLDCSPFGKHNTKTINREYKCRVCGDTDPAHFPKGRYGECRKCRNRYNKKADKTNKLQAVIYLGGKCSCCGYDKYLCALDIHHIDPDDKNENFRRHSGWSWKKLKQELDKCILLCANCHRAFHAGFIAENDFIFNDAQEKIKKFRESRANTK